MATSKIKTITLPFDLAQEVEEQARTEGKTFSDVVQEALGSARKKRRLRHLRAIQGYWQRMARERGILSEQDLERYLRS